MNRELYDHISAALTALDQGIYVAENADRPFIAKLLDEAFELVVKAEEKYR